MAMAVYPPWWRSFWLGIGPGLEHQAIPFRQSMGTVVDIGSNRGQFALFAQRRFPNAGIHCFEPLAVPCAVLRVLFEGDSRVEIHNVAVGPVNGCATMMVADADDSSSLLPLAAAQSDIFGVYPQGTEEVTIRPLADLVSVQELPSPRLLKLDVQGFELSCLKGCEPLEAFDQVYVECSYIELYRGQALAGEVIAWLTTRGFNLAGVFNQVERAGTGAVQADFLFHRST